MKKLYGIFSLLCFAAAVGLGFEAIHQSSVQWSLLYLLITAASGIVVIGAFCAKCPVKTECAHVLPGLAARLLNRPPGPYSKAEMLLTSLAIGIILIFPQPWLFRNMCLLVPFWTISLAGLLFIVRNICGTCQNKYCPYGKSFQKENKKSGAE